MSLSVINDLHCGVVRSGGTTPKSAWALRQWVLRRLDQLLMQIQTDLLILGDLLDTYSVPYYDLLSVIDSLEEWLTENPDRTLFLVPGNHDLSKTTATMSSFQFLCRLLRGKSNVVVLNEPGPLPRHDAYVIPHVVNQEQFNIELDKVPEVGTLYVHCNYDNKFAQKSDHSLNLSADQALKLPVKRIVFAHEHQARTAMNGKVIVIGNQIPTSVADCLGNDAKFFLQVDAKGATSGYQVWGKDEEGAEFVRVDWRDISTKLSPDYGKFIRVEGEAASSEANAVVSAISKLRNTHNAFVITNAVKIEGQKMDGIDQTLEKAQTYDVRSALMKRLSEAQRTVVEKLLAEHGEQA